MYDNFRNNSVTWIHKIFEGEVVFDIQVTFFLVLFVKICVSQKDISWIDRPPGMPQEGVYTNMCWKDHIMQKMISLACLYAYLYGFPYKITGWGLDNYKMMCFHGSLANVMSFSSRHFLQTDKNVWFGEKDTQPNTNAFLLISICPVSNDSTYCSH